MISGEKCVENFSLRAYCNLVKKVSVVILLPRFYILHNFSIYSVDNFEENL